MMFSSSSVSSRSAGERSKTFVTGTRGGGTGEPSYANSAPSVWHRRIASSRCAPAISLNFPPSAMTDEDSVDRNKRHDWNPQILTQKAPSEQSPYTMLRGVVRTNPPLAYLGCVRHLREFLFGICLRRRVLHSAD